MKYVTLLMFALAFPALPLDESALNGAYHYRYLHVAQAQVGGPIEVEQSLGTLLFDGRGTYTEGPQRGGYIVNERGFVTLAAPRTLAALDARISPQAGVLLGSSLENTGTNDLFLAVRTSLTPAALRGVYHAAVLLLPSTRTAGAVSTQTSFDIADARLQVFGDGTGNLTLPLTTNLPTLSYNIAASGDGSVLIGSPRSGRGLLVAVAASREAAAGTYWTLAMALDGGRAGTAVGSLRIEGERQIRLSQRWNTAGQNFDYAGIRPIGAPGTGNGTLVTANPPGQSPSLTFAVRVPLLQGTGVFLNPHGIANAASDAPVGAPISSGALLTISGDGFADSPASAASLPLPTTLGGMQVAVNNTPAGLHSVDRNLVRLVMPPGTPSGWANIVVRNGAGASQRVTMRVSASNPAIFANPGSNAALATHLDYGRVSPAAPARTGEVIALFATGLGSRGPELAVWIGGEPAEVLYAGPTSLPGLDQVNIRIPKNARAGDAIPVSLFDGESFSDTTTIPIAVASAAVAQ